MNIFQIQKPGMANKRPNLNFLLLFMKVRDYSDAVSGGQDSDNTSRFDDNTSRLSDKTSRLSDKTIIYNDLLRLYGFSESESDFESLDDVEIGNDSSKKRTIDLFWKNYYKKIDDAIANDTIKYSNLSPYHNAVFQLLKKNQKLDKSNQVSLLSLQQEIEDLTMNFDERNVFKSFPSLIKIMICQDKITAKEYLKRKQCGLSEMDLTTINMFSEYTLEAIMIHVLGSVFNCVQDLPFVRVSTLIEQIDSTVRVQAVNIGMNKAASKDDVKLFLDKKSKVTRSHYAIGARLVDFLAERNLIKWKTDESYKAKKDLPVSKKKDLPVSKKKGYYIPLNSYAMCNFDLSLLPIKFNLPMVCKPLSWQCKVNVPSTLSDITGGYLSELTGEVYNRFRLLTSRDYSHFYIKLKSPQDMCNVLNSLQSQAFEINQKFLDFILENSQTLEEAGILMKNSLARVNLQDASDLLRFCYFNDEGVKDVCSCHFLLTELVKRVQRARYEEFVLTLATAYSSYQFYLPAFMDFHGRIYRAGVFHFHERDLAKSLIFFSKAPEKEQLEEYKLRGQLACAAAFKYKKFSSLKDSFKWYIQNMYAMTKSGESLIHLAEKASDAFQFLSKVLSNESVSDLERIHGLNSVPVTKDASASAYQIMSYLLLNEEMGRRTNLLPSPKIQDLYMCLKTELLEFLHSRLDTNKYAIIKSRLTRQLVKRVFMPLIYGKTVITMTSDIRDVYGSLLRFKDYYHIAQLCHAFFINKYPDIANLMKLINLIGWFCSVLGKPVLYSIPYFTTVQDYMRSDKVYIWVYDRMNKKRRRVTLRVPTSDRDKRKTQVSTCVNFIHQRDAFIAMKVVEQFTLKTQGPVYTVHDNFITTSVYATEVPDIYTKVFMGMGPPLRIINEFIHLNLIPPTIGELSNEPSPLYSDSVNDPIPGEYLRTLLISLEPKYLSLKDKLKWDKDKLKREKKIDDIVSCYEEYVNTVCGEALPPDGGMRHAEKWQKYHSLLNSWESLSYNNSLHF